MNLYYNINMILPYIAATIILIIITLLGIFIEKKKK